MSADGSVLDDLEALLKQRGSGSGVASDAGASAADDSGGGAGANGAPGRGSASGDDLEGSGIASQDALSPDMLRLRAWEDYLNGIGEKPLEDGSL